MVKNKFKMEINFETEHEWITQDEVVELRDEIHQNLLRRLNAEFPEVKDLSSVLVII